MDDESGTLTFNQVWRIFRYIFTLFVALSIVFLVRSMLMVNINIQEAQSSILINNFLFSNNCFSYYDLELDRPLPGVIDPFKFTSKVADDCAYFGETNDFAAAQITLIKKEDSSEHQIFYNKEGYELLEPRLGFSGSGSVIKFEELRYILIKNDDVMEPGIIHIKLLMPSS